MSTRPKVILACALLYSVAALVALTACGNRGSSRSRPVDPIAITTTTLPDGESGTPYSVDLRATGGRVPLDWSITAGALPPGLSLGSSSGAITGTPAANGIFDFTVQVADAQAVPLTDTASFRILVYSQPGANTAPGVLLAAVLGTRRGLVDHTYLLIDVQSDPSTIVAEASTDSGATWFAPTPGAGGDGPGPHATHPAGRDYVFQWDSMADLGPVRLDTVRVRLTPSDRATGIPDETADYVIDNRPGQIVFRRGPTMLDGRRGHTATLLDSGEVLIAGGTNSKGVVLGTAEIFDPVQDVFLPLPAMSAPRMLHSATLLPDGRVLIAGGVDDSSFEYTSAEVFDPVAGTFQPVGSMATNRAGHAAVSTSAGVFVLGGHFLSGIVPVHYDDGHEYDPAGDLFLTPALGPLLEERSLHDALELPSGRVLLVGGGMGTNLSVEEFDPATGTGVEQQVSASANQVVNHGSALLQNGTALLVGGGPGRELITIDAAFDQAFVYDPTAAVGARFTDVGPLAHSRRWHTATVLADGRVAVIGGQDRNFATVGESEIYDPAVAGLSIGAVMMGPRFQHRSTRLQDGRVLVTGGTADGTADVSVSELLGP